MQCLFCATPSQMMLTHQHVHKCRLASTMPSRVLNRSAAPMQWFRSVLRSKSTLAHVPCFQQLSLGRFSSPRLAGAHCGLISLLHQPQELKCPFMIVSTNLWHPGGYQHMFVDASPAGECSFGSLFCLCPAFFSQGITCSSCTPVF